MKTFNNHIRNLGIFAIGVDSHHYGGKLLDRNNELEEAKNQAERDSKLDEIAVNVRNLVKDCKEISNTKADSINLSKEALSGMNNKAELLQYKSSKIMENLELASKPSVNNKSELLKNVKEMVSETQEFKKLISDALYSSNKPGNNLNPINDLYNYLDTLSLLQEASLLHFIMFSVLLITIINILLILFSNVILNYFNLENKYPKLAKWLILRSKIQRIGITWNVIILILICILGIFLNILGFIKG